MKSTLLKSITVAIVTIVTIVVASATISTQAQRRSYSQNKNNQTSRVNKRNPSKKIQNIDMRNHDNEGKVKCKSSGKASNSSSNTVSPTAWEPNKEVAVSFNQFPASLAEWKRMQEQLGGTPEGAVALQVMAFELYRNNRSDGEAALRLNNTSTNYNSTVERLKEIMGKDQYYARPYIAWALLQGATPENGYTVRPPYTVSMKVDPNKKYQESQLLKGTVIYLLIDSKGWDTNWRGVEVVKPAGSNYYVVSNCPAMYTQCKEALK